MLCIIGIIYIDNKFDSMNDTNLKRVYQHEGDKRSRVFLVRLHNTLHLPPITQPNAPLHNRHPVDIGIIYIVFILILSTENKILNPYQIL